MRVHIQKAGDSRFFFANFKALIEWPIRFGAARNDGYEIPANKPNKPSTNTLGHNPDNRKSLYEAQS
jgi:hypothetical protein